MKDFIKIDSIRAELSKKLVSFGYALYFNKKTIGGKK